MRAKLPFARYALLGAGALLVVGAFFLGRRSGRRRSTVVEIRRG